MDFLNNNKKSFYGGVITFSLTAAGVFLMGNISGYEAKQLIQASLAGINMLCNTIVLASATILALILTLIGVSSGTKTRLKKEHYLQVIRIAKVDSVLFIAALILFQIFNIPVTESDTLPSAWYKYMYWATLIFSSFLSGFMVSVVLMLYSTIRNIIAIIGLDQDHQLVTKESDESSP